MNAVSSEAFEPCFLQIALSLYGLIGVGLRIVLEFG